MPIENVREFLALAQDRFRQAQTAESRIRDEALIDLRFRAGEQWPDEIKAQREVEKRPCLTINRLPQFLRQVTNEQRMNRPAIQVDPVDDAADPETAEIIQGIIRHIERNSNAEAAWDKAFEDAATGGFGYVRILADWADPFAFEQELRIEPIRNPFSVYIDPAARQPDRSDMRWAFIVEDIPRDEYRERFPDSDMAGITEFGSIGDRANFWLAQDSVRVAEYFWIESRRATLAMLADGQVAIAEELAPGAPVVRTRPTMIPVVQWALINAVEVLEERDVPGRYIGIIPVLGEELIIDGELRLAGMVRYARDPQRMYNYWASAETEMIALAPKAPWVAAEGQIEGHEHLYRDANTKNIGVLPYKPRALGNVLVPPPQRVSVEPPIMAISTARMQSADDLKATTGIYDASLGARSNETSGIAIARRQQEGDTANYHLIDNLRRAMKHAGRVLLDMIPRIYDTPRVMRILGVDEQPKTVTINAPVLEGGVERIYDLSVGRYDVTISTGPSYTTRRQETVQAIMQLTQAYPALMQVAGDLLVENMDWPGARAIARRLKRTLPPELQEEQAEGPAQIPPQVQAQMKALMQQHEQLVAALTEAQQQIQGRRLEIESRERIAALQVQADLIKTEANLASRENIELLRAEMARIREDIQAMMQPADDDTAGPGEMPAAA